MPEVHAVVPLPPGGGAAAAGFGGKRANKETFYSYTSFTTPLTITMTFFGATRRFVFQSLLAEATLLAFFGGATGLAVASLPSRMTRSA